MKKLKVKHLNSDVKYLSIALALACALIMSWSALKEFDKIAIFGFFLLPFILKIDKEVVGSYRYVILTIVFALLFFVFGQSYWALACGISLVFATIELKAGKLNVMAFYALLFYLPITRSFFMLFGFYIRLEITKWAAKLISLFYPIVSFEGTQIFNDGEQFSVDAGCMGLRLVITGFLLTLLILNQTALSLKIKLKPRVVSAFLLLSFLLIILGNFFRIVVLILLNSPEGTWSHELIGICSLILFHLIPMVLIARYTLKKKWVVDGSHPPSQNRASTISQISLIIVSIVMISQLIFDPKPQQQSDINYRFKGYTANQSNDGIVTYRRDNSIFTIKPINPFSFSNHHPMLCWRGDGFEISNEARSKIGENECMQATLKSTSQGNLNTVWWYTNTVDFATTSEIEWRYRAIIKQEPFYILNFTCDNTDELIYTINNITHQIENQNLLK